MSEEVKFSELVHFHDAQIQATQAADHHQYTFYGGSRGPGKSYWLRWYCIRELLKLAKKGIKKPIGGLFCEDYPSLKDRQISKLATECPDWLGELRDSKEYGLGLHIHPHYGGGVLALRNLDDATKYLSAEFAIIGVDELTRNPLETFNYLRGSLRWRGVPQPRFVAAANPGGIGHIWVRSYWIDSSFPPEMEALSPEFAFVRALPDDTPYLDTSYWQLLESLPPDLARAWRWGDWDVFQGQFFGELRREIHGFHGDPPPGWNFCSLDYGESAPSSVHWWRVADEGGIWGYRELYTPGLLYVPLKQQIHAMTGKEIVRYTQASPDIFAKSKGTGVVGAEVFASNEPDYGGFSWPLMKADDNRIEGWRHMKHFIHTNNLHVSLDTCPHWWRTVPAMIYDEAKGEDMDDRGEDHAAEETRYGLMSRPKPTVKPVEVELPVGRTRAIIKERQRAGQPQVRQEGYY